LRHNHLRAVVVVPIARGHRPGHLWAQAAEVDQCTDGCEVEHACHLARRDDAHLRHDASLHAPDRARALEQELSMVLIPLLATRWAQLASHHLESRTIAGVNPDELL